MSDRIITTTTSPADHIRSCRDLPGPLPFLDLVGRWCMPGVKDLVCLVVWCGDHKQTPGGLRKSDEARAFRRKLMRRPIALRGDTKFIPPHMLGAIVHPYVQDVPGLQVAGLRQLLQESTRQPLGLSTGSVAVFQELCKETIGSCWDAFFFGQRCARHNDSGSHEDMLNWSSVDNSIAQIGQWTKRKQTQNKQTAPTTKPKPNKADQSMKVRQVKHVCALTTWCIAQKPRLSQHLQQLVECHTSNNGIPCGPQLPGRA